jgi:hypothetical protein
MLKQMRNAILLLALIMIGSPVTLQAETKRANRALSSSLSLAKSAQLERWYKTGRTSNPKKEARPKLFKNVVLKTCAGLLLIVAMLGTNYLFFNIILLLLFLELWLLTIAVLLLFATLLFYFMRSQCNKIDQKWSRSDT